MRILFLTHAFNSLAQRLFLDLTELGHEVSVEFDISDAVTIEAVALYRPDLVVAPFLKRAIPEAVWRATTCFIVHPGIVGDRGPSSLDWAISQGLSAWGVTVLQAQAEMDAGPVWATEVFAMRAATKSSLYRNEVTEAAALAVRRAVQHFEATPAAPPPVPSPLPAGRWRPAMKQADRRIDWQRDDTATVLRRIRAADGSPGVLDALFGHPCRLYDAHAQSLPQGHEPGVVVARRDEAVLRATVDGGVWIGHVRRLEEPGDFKLPTALAFAPQVAALPEWPAREDDAATRREIRHETHGDVACLHFAFHNGAMSTAQCERLTAVLRQALERPVRVLVLFGGPDFWSNGIHLNVIEAADSPADESWRNIVAVDELCRTLIEATACWIVAAMQGNAGAGGVFMALAADRVWARRGIVLNPHYKNMGNLYGSEYWTYLLPRRLGSRDVGEVMGRRLPLSAPQAMQLGLVDEVYGEGAQDFVAQTLQRAAALAASPQLPALLQAKRQRRHSDEAHKPLAAYRDEELARMRRNFYGFDPSYHIARSNFVRHLPASWTPRHLCLHRGPSTAPATPRRPEADASQSATGARSAESP